MTPSRHFLERIGLSEQVQRWLRQNKGDPLREEILALFMKALSQDYPQELTDPLRKKIAQIKL